MECLFIFGTRPEAIKLAPLIRVFRSNGLITPVVAVTGQHRDMLDQVLAFFGVTPDFDLNLMEHGQSICGLTSRAITGLDSLMKKRRPAIVAVQGDTTTAMCGAYVSFMHRIPVAHIEAGLRSGRRDEPFPEEVNRQIIANLADLHFCATRRARENLIAENAHGESFLVGNTVVDALHLGLAKLEEGWTPSVPSLQILAQHRQAVLVTLHRRETFGMTLHEILQALRFLAERHTKTKFVFPVHPNPEVAGPVKAALGEVSNFLLVEPLDYPHLLWTMSKCSAILTDSGGIQEEAPSLGIPVVVARNVTERQEGIEAGVAVLAGTSRDGIVEAMDKVLANPTRHNHSNPYGDGLASKRIHYRICAFLGCDTKLKGTKSLD